MSPRDADAPARTGGTTGQAQRAPAPRHRAAGSAARRVWSVMYRHLALFRRSWPRVVELAYWPLLQMLIWGFVTAYLAGQPRSAGTVAAGALLGGVLLWEVAVRSQMGFAVSFLEEVWSRNLGQLFVAPLRPREYAAALMGMSVLRMLAGVLPAILIAFLLYGFNLFAIGPVIVLFFAALMAMGWAVAFGVTALVMRYGAGAETLAWSVLMGLTPFSAVFYPVSVLPAAVQPLSWLIPASHVFEGMRAALLEGRVAWGQLALAFALDAAWLAGMIGVFLWQFRRARERGALLNIGE